MSRRNASLSTVTDLIGVKPVATLDGGQPAQWSFPTLAAAALGKGEAVCLSGGTGVAMGITPIGTNASGYGILGFTSEAIASTVNASTFTGVYIATPDTVFVGNVNQATTSAAAQTAVTDIGQLYGLTTMSGISYVDKAKTTFGTQTMVRVIGLNDQDDHPCFYGKVNFMVLGQKTQLHSDMWSSLSGQNVAT